MKTKLLLLLFSFTLAFDVSAQTPKVEIAKDGLYQEILKMDSLLFQVAFNTCDLVLYEKIVSTDLEFYDDRSGLNTSYEKEVNAFIDKCSKPFSVTRQLVKCTVHVLGDFGAVQIGEHNFYVDGNKVENAKFITVWEKKEEDWVMKRAISYDHVSKE